MRAPLSTFLVAHVFTEEPDGTLRVSFTRGGLRSVSEALSVAEERAVPGQYYQVRRVTQRAWDVWAVSGCGHVLPVQGETVREAFPLSQAS